MVQPQTNRELAPQFEEYLLAKSLGEQRIRFYLHVFQEVSAFVRNALVLDCPVESLEAFFEEKIEEGLSLGRQKAYREVLEEILAFQEDYYEWMEPRTLSSPVVTGGTSPGMSRARPPSQRTSPGMPKARPKSGSMEDLPVPVSFESAPLQDEVEGDFSFEPTALFNAAHYDELSGDLPALVDPRRKPSASHRRPASEPLGSLDGVFHLDEDEDLPFDPSSGLGDMISEPNLPAVAQAKHDDSFLLPTGYDDVPVPAPPRKERFSDPFPLLGGEDEDEDDGVWELPDLPDDEELDLLEFHTHSEPGYGSEPAPNSGSPGPLPTSGPSYALPGGDDFGDDFGDFGDDFGDFGPLPDELGGGAEDELGLDFSSIPPPASSPPSPPQRHKVERPRSQEPLSIDANAVIAVVSNTVELQGAGESKQIQDFFQSEQSGSGGEAVAFSRLSSLSPGFGLPGGEQIESNDFISSDDLLSDVEEELDFGAPQLDSDESRGEKKRGPSLRSVSVPDHVVESAKPRKVGAGDVDTLKRFTKNLDVRTSKPQHGVATRRKVGFLYEDTYHIPIKTPKPRNFEAGAEKSLAPGAIQGMLAPVVVPAVICIITIAIGVVIGINAVGAILMGMGAMGLLGFIGLGFYFMRRSAAPIRRQTPNAVFDSYISAIRHRNWAAARACLARPLTEGSDFNVAPPSQQAARWLSLKKEHRMSRFHSHPVGVVRRAGGAEDSGAVILVSILVPEQQYIVIPAVRLKQGWFLTDGELCIRQVGEPTP